MIRGVDHRRPIAAGEKLANRCSPGSSASAGRRSCEALLQLDSRGFVEMTPRRGAVVRPLSTQDAAETYEVKARSRRWPHGSRGERMDPDTLRS